MMILKFTDFINEARKDKKELTEVLRELLDKKPPVKISDKTQKDVYSMSGIIKYFKNNNLSSQNATDAIHTYQNDRELKKSFKHISVKDFETGKSNPYYYMDLTKEEVDKIKENLEKNSKEKAAPELAKKAEVKKKSVALSKERKEKKTIIASRKKVAEKK
jgi:hypothetical protein